MSNNRKIVGIGGIFFKSEDIEKLQKWYKDYLGFSDIEPWGKVFKWKESDSRKDNYTVWGSFKADTDYFEPSDKPYMINYIVQDLEIFCQELKEDGIDVTDIEIHEQGKFAWLVDPDGTKLELWEPA